MVIDDFTQADEGLSLLLSGESVQENNRNNDNAKITDFVVLKPPIL